jgi:hypothetical protein
MPRGLYVDKPQNVVIREYDEGALQDNHVRIQTEFAAIKQLISSMPVWGNPLREHPVWDNDRLRQTVVEMFRNGSLSSAEVVDPIVDFDASARAFMDILDDPSEAVKLGIRF